MATKRKAKTVFPGLDDVSQQTRSLVIDKLTSSGLDLDDMITLGIEVLEPAQTAALSTFPNEFRAIASIKLNYWDPLKPVQPLAAGHGWPQFFRVRYLDTEASFAALADKKPQRYMQPGNSGLCAYFPRNVHRQWREIFNDPEAPLIITEGEFKAAKACKEGFPAIGLGGVHSFKSAKAGIDLLPELARIDWVKRCVYVIYDNDYQTNENVCRALNELAEALAERGALPFVIPLPDTVEDGKTGLDDFLVEAGPVELANLLHQLPQPLTLARPLWKLNNEVIYVRNPGLIVVRDTNAKLNPTAFTTHAYAQAKYSEQVMTKNGISMKRVPAANAWLQWPLRAEAARITYSPGKPKFIENGVRSKTAWNIWPGWGVKPKKGDVAPFLRLINHVFTGIEPDAKDWFLNWCAYPLQYPGIKLFSAAVVYGIKHGTGKSLIGYTLGRIYGQNFTEISGKDLHTNFNEWAEAKQFVMGDDVTGSDKREDNDVLKKMITQKSLRVNTKFVPSYDVPDCINYYFTSNQPDSFFLEDNDRRFFIHEVIVDPLPEEFYVEYELWLETGGAEHVFDWLLHKDLGTFNPAAKAYMTSAKQRMIFDTKSDLGSWVSRLIADPDNILRIGEMPLEGDLFTNRQLLDLYDPMGKTRTTANGLGRELRRSGAMQVCGGTPITTNDGQQRYYIIRNRDRWMNAKAPEVRRYIDGVADQPPEKKKKKY